MSTRTHKPAKPLVLPRAMPNGKTTKAHPLVWCIDTLRPANEAKARLAEHMGVRPQSLYKWLAKCKEDRNFSIPAERAMQVATFFDVPASLFRPDVFVPVTVARAE